MTKENLLVTENQGLDLDEQKKKDILDVIESCSSFQETIKQLEKKNLIWYFIGSLRKDKDIKEQINLKWENEFQKFEQSITATHRKFEESLPGENFLVYTTKDNDFQIRFENKEKPIEISALLRASDEGKVYNLSLGQDSQITATKKGSERHYDFAGSSSCEMTINWQAKDSKGNSIDCSMTVEVSSKGIIGEPRFGGITSSEEALKLVEQNKEVFINGKTLYQAFTDMSKSVNEQQTPAEETFTKDSPQSATPSSSGYSSLNTPSSRRSSLSISSEFNGEDEIFESDTFSDEEEHKQGGKGLEDRVAELEKENTYLKKENAELKSRNTKITEEGEAEASQLIEGKQDLEKEVTILKDELKRKEKELAEKDQDIKKLELEVNVLKQSEKDKNARITDLINQLKDKESEVRSTNRINEELQEKFKQSEAKLSALEKKNANLENNLKKTLAEGPQDNHEKQLLEELTEEKGKNNTLAKEMKQLSQEFNELQRKNEDLERKIQQLESGKSLADEMSEVNTNEEIDKLKQQFKAKEGMLQEELKSVKEALEKLQDILQQEKDLAAISTQTEVEYESRGIQANTQEIIVPKTQDQGTNAGIDASSSTDQKESKKEEDQINRTKSVNNLVPVDPPSFTDQKEKNRTNRPENIMDWPTPIPCDGLGADPAKPTKVLLDPKSTPAKGSEKSIS
ncbi:coiled-coil domain-containing protein [Wolbachia endosymbiont of Chrysomya megacephala]|uniref:hypothetical protein n=1 Tax=Wolbachia endosymbiont of Chrysomya megacephala TaxID=1335053 RepID=UPI0011EF4F53|nr:hypothetical protein [Wolbachia endosymbiont of Chrysomya megacephala]QEK89692.1 hypothetical protein CAI20_03140 [Wolbachia endosymbiont of Chrysomya megacephala]